MFTPLREVITPSAAHITTESRDNGQGGKDLYMHGIFIQGDKRNQNERVYPVNEITSAVKTLREKINSGFSVLGEADHPDDLNINIDRVSHAIVEMDMQGNDGIGKLKMLPTPMGNICKTLLESGVKLGVSSRGSGNVDGSGNVSDFEIVTVDIVANPSAPDAYPDPIYEQIMNHRRGGTFWDVAESVNHDYKAQKYLKEEMKRFIQDLGRR
jgi:hypothetical protein|tara:strand:- start:1745 stop:2380 length:636 start_codon:yes stop_codon:yes gene_type:complete